MATVRTNVMASRRHVLQLGDGKPMSGEKEDREAKADKRPRGREEVRNALIDAANQLFGLKGPDAVSVRDVARRADVNHALLHRHFGSKEQLLHDVMQEHASDFLRGSSNATAPGEAVSLMFDLMADRPAFARIVAHLLLSGHPPADFAARGGGLSRIRELVHESEPEASLETAQIKAAAGAAFSMGWVLFENFVLYGVGYKGNIGEARNIVRQYIAHFLNCSHTD